jgi:hypothetical protein
MAYSVGLFSNKDTTQRDTIQGSERRLVIPNGLLNDWLVLDCIAETTLYGNLERQVGLGLDHLEVKPLEEATGGRVQALLMSNGRHFITGLVSPRSSGLQQMKIVDDVHHEKKSLTAMSTPEGNAKSYWDDNYFVCAILVVSHETFRDVSVNVATNKASDCLSAACAAFYMAIPRLWWDTVMPWLFVNVESKDAKEYALLRMMMDALDNRDTLSATTKETFIKCLRKFENIEHGEKPKHDACLEVFRREVERAYKQLANIPGAPMAVQRALGPVHVVYNKDKITAVEQYEFLSYIYTPFVDHILGDFGAQDSMCLRRCSR